MRLGPCLLIRIEKGNFTPQSAFSISMVSCAL